MVRDILPADDAAAIAVLKLAFAQDPALSFLLPDPAVRDVVAPRLAGTWLRYARGWGRAWCTDGLEGVALRRPPGAEDFHPWGVLASGMWQTPFLLGPAGTWRLIQAAWAMEQRHRAAISGPHWYCWLLAVDPAHQGKGLGADLMAHTFDQADADGVPCYLETTSERALSVHLSHGYEVLVDGQVPGTELRVWSMVRPPRKRLKIVA